MVLRHRSIFASLAIAVLAAPFAIVHALERAAVALFDLIAPAFADKRDFRLATPDGIALSMTREPFDPALQNSLRHEAGFHRRAASRGG